MAASERRHTGEIRICIEAGLPASYLWRDATPRERAIAMFGKLRVWDTEQNNGVLIYLLLAEHAIEIVADRGLSRHVPDAQWQEVVRAWASSSARAATRGLKQAVDAVAALLVRHFPARAGAANATASPHPPLGGGALPPQARAWAAPPRVGVRLRQARAPLGAPGGAVPPEVPPGGARG